MPRRSTAFGVLKCVVSLSWRRGPLPLFPSVRLRRRCRRPIIAARPVSRPVRHRSSGPRRLGPHRTRSATASVQIAVRTSPASMIRTARRAKAPPRRPHRVRSNLARSITRVIAAAAPISIIGVRAAAATASLPVPAITSSPDDPGAPSPPLAHSQAAPPARHSAARRSASHPPHHKLPVRAPPRDQRRPPTARRRA